jgi:hypothetical protein
LQCINYCRIILIYRHHLLLYTKLGNSVLTPHSFSASSSSAKLISWTASATEIKLKVNSEVLSMNGTSSLFARMLVIALSSRDDVDWEEVA